MKTYVDTSVLFSLYAPDSNSARADKWRLQNPQPLPVSAFHRLELQNALKLAVFQKRLTPQDIANVWKDVEDDLVSGSLVYRGGLWHRVLKTAEELSNAHTDAVGARTLDVIHVAAASLMGISEFCTFDPRQSRLAVNAGLTLSSI